VQPHVIGIAQYGTPTPILGATALPFYTYPLHTSIAQHTEPTNATLLSVATAIIPVPAGIPEYVSPSILIEFDRTGTGFQSVLDPNVYYEVALLAGTAPTPDHYQNVAASSVSAYVTLPTPLSTTTASVPASTGGNPPKFADVLAAVNAVLSKDPGGPPTTAEIAALTFNQCRNIAYQIVYRSRAPLPPVPPGTLEPMYTDPPNTGAPSNSNEQALSQFQGALAGYYGPKDAAANQLTNFVFSLSAALWCEQQSQKATSVILNFPVNPNPSTPPINATGSEAEVILTGVVGIDIPAQYFYALTAQMPAQMTAAARFAMATTGDEQQNLTQLTNAVSSGWIDMAATMSLPQAVRILSALAVPAGSTVTQCPITPTIKPIWTDWLAYPSPAWLDYSTLPSTYIFQPGDDVTFFWPAEANRNPGDFLDLVLFTLTEGYQIPTSAGLLKDAILAHFTPSITNVGQLAAATPAEWQTFFASLPGILGVSAVAVLPAFTAPGTVAIRIAAFIRYFQSFFGVQPVAPPTFLPNTAPLPSLNLPAFDLIAQTIAAYSGFKLSSPLVLLTLQHAAKAAVPNDPQAQAWAVQAVSTINELFILTSPPTTPPTLPPQVPANLQFSVMEALFARGFTSIEDVLDLPKDDFQQALTGTVAYDYAPAMATPESPILGRRPVRRRSAPSTRDRLPTVSRRCIFLRSDRSLICRRC
jgi:hypothetical protein